MTTRPTTSPEFATDATFTAGAESGLSSRLDPGSGFRLQGWYPNRRMPARWFNWLVGLLGDWILYLSKKTDHVFSPLNFSATGDGTADDTAELQACFDAATASVTAGRLATVDLGGKSYRITADLDCPADVKVRNGKLVLDHASENCLSFGSSLTPDVRVWWEDVKVDFAQGNSGVIVGNSVPGVLVGFRNCRFNDSALCTGRMFLGTGGSDFTFEDCFARIPLNNPGFRSDGGTLVIEGGELRPPAAYADSVVEGTGGRHTIRNVTFNMNGVTSGNAVCVNVAGQIATIDGCTFDDNLNGNTAIAAITGSALRAQGNEFLGNIVPYDFAGPLAEGYSVELLPHYSLSAGGSAFSLPAGYLVYSIDTTSATAPDLTMPGPLFRGQPADVVVKNDHASTAWGLVNFLSALFDGSTWSGLAAQSTRSCRFVVVDLDGALTWVQMGGVGTTP